MVTTIELKRNLDGNFSVGNPEVSFDSPPPIDVTVVPGTTNVRIGVLEGTQSTVDEIARAVAAKIYPNASEDDIAQCAQSLSEHFSQFFSEGRLIQSNVKTVIPAPEECVEGLYPIIQEEEGITTVRGQNLWEYLISPDRMNDSGFGASISGASVILAVIIISINQWRKKRAASSPSFSFAQHTPTPQPVELHEQKSIIQTPVVDPIVRINKAEVDVRMRPAHDALQTIDKTLTELSLADVTIADSVRKTQKQVENMGEEVTAHQQQLLVLEKKLQQINTSKK